MKQPISEVEDELLVTDGEFPCVSVIIPLAKGFYRQRELVHQLNSAKAQLKKTLATFYPEQQSHIILEKLDHLTKAIHIPAKRKSLLLFVSPQLEKMHFLREEVKPRMLINHSFEIRDLAKEATSDKEALTLILSADKAVLYHLKDGELNNVDLGIPDESSAYERDAPEKVANFSDTKQRRQVLVEKFLRHVDRALSIKLKSYHLPVYLMAPIKIAGLFKKYSQNLSAVCGYQHGNYVHASPAQLITLLNFAVRPLNQNSKDLQQEMEEAAGEKKLASGINEVWAAASHKNAKLLIMEEDFIFAGHRGIAPDAIYLEDPGLKRPVFIKDAADDVIEKVISCGGDIRFVATDDLKDYGHIALIQYYRE